MYSSFDELHGYLTREMGLVAEPEHGGAWRTCFYKEIVWHPSMTTRTIKVLLGDKKTPFKVQLCVSSDNNNSVFISAPFTRDALTLAIQNETPYLLR
jgi:hypothetical protein